MIICRRMVDVDTIKVIQVQTKIKLRVYLYKELWTDCVEFVELIDFYMYHIISDICMSICLCIYNYVSIATNKFTCTRRKEMYKSSFYSSRICCSAHHHDDDEKKINLQLQFLIMPTIRLSHSVMCTL